MTRLLTDVDVANLLHASDLSYRGRTPTFHVEYPTTIEQVNTRFNLFTDDDQKLFSNSIVFYPINTGSNHWVLLITDTRPEVSITTYIDPLGNKCPSTLRNNINTRFTHTQNIDSTGKIQYEGFECGVWVCWLFNIYLDALHHNAFFTPSVRLIDWLQPGSVFVDAADHEDDIKNRNRGFISSMRSAYFASLSELIERGVQLYENVVHN